MLAQRMADSAKLTHEKRIIKKFRNVIANSFWEQECFVSFFFFSLETMYFRTEACRERDTEIKKLKSPLVSLEIFLFFFFLQCCSAALKLVKVYRYSPDILLK